ncbi:hypothetical protein OPIT5_17400 [Opitutaceae bacterium TAV5]|nr:hypothetical protein OPIT5_17400 [Opitutaceae bacterium TAV5]
MLQATRHSAGPFLIMKHSLRILAFSAVVSGAITAGAPTGLAAPLLNENFESVSPGAAPAGWTVTAPENTSVAVTDTVASGGERSLRFDDNAEVSGFPSAVAGFTPASTGIVSVSLDIRASANNRDSLYVKLRNTDNQEIGGVRFGLNGTFSWQLDTGAWQNSTVTYAADQWYSLKIDYNLDTRTYSAWVNDSVVVTDTAFRTIANNSGAASLLFQSMAGVASYTGSAWIDNLEVSVTTIPEPSATAALAGGACALLLLSGRLRRRSRSPGTISSLQR